MPAYDFEFLKQPHEDGFYDFWISRKADHIHYKVKMPSGEVLINTREFLAPQFVWNHDTAKLLIDAIRQDALQQYELKKEKSRLEHRLSQYRGRPRSVNEWRQLGFFIDYLAQGRTQEIEDRIARQAEIIVKNVLKAPLAVDQQLANVLFSNLFSNTYDRCPNLFLWQKMKCLRERYPLEALLPQIERKIKGQLSKTIREILPLLPQGIEPFYAKLEEMLLFDRTLLQKFNPILIQFRELWIAAEGLSPLGSDDLILQDGIQLLSDRLAHFLVHCHGLEQPLKEAELDEHYLHFFEVEVEQQCAPQLLSTYLEAALISLHPMFSDVKTLLDSSTADRLLYPQLLSLLNRADAPLSYGFLRGLQSLIRQQSLHPTLGHRFEKREGLVATLTGRLTSCFNDLYLCRRVNQHLKFMKDLFTHQQALSQVLAVFEVLIPISQQASKTCFNFSQNEVKMLNQDVLKQIASFALQFLDEETPADAPLLYVGEPQQRMRFLPGPSTPQPQPLLDYVIDQHTQLVDGGLRAGGC